MSTVISVENVSKAYRLGQIGGGTLKEDVARWWAKLRGRPDPFLKIGEEHHARHMGEQFWALDNVSFEVKQGEVLGIIGRNGAGKSTLLKILSQVTTPTSGQIKIKGRIASLLEVGTGFNPEMTGRENIFLNGAILGMTKAEIRKNFDEIVAFSGVEEFIDTPVKRYSSGMYVRLAFAVAAHLEPEILIVDEVLAVGDAEFQKKCIGKMQDVAGHGRTILFVSHNIGAVRTLCSTGILLKNGKLEISGPIDDIIGAYMDSGVQQANSHTVIIPKPPKRCTVWMESVSILCNGNRKSTLEIGDKLCLEVKFRSYDPIQRPIIGYLIRSSRGEDLVNANNYFLPSPDYPTPVTDGTIVCDLGDLPLMSGSYSVSFWLCRNPHEQHHVEDVLHFTVEEKNIWGTDALPNKSLGGLWWPTQFRFSAND
jgi:lipopolysaccharide transport system ATP-binding protein